MKVTIGLDYRKFLKDELEQRKSKNHKYSLRAFARDLKISTSRLSEIFSGKSGLSHEKASQICDLLSLSAQDKALFLDLVESEHARSGMAKKMAKERVAERLKNFIDLDARSMALVGDWRSFAIYEYLLVQPNVSLEEISLARAQLGSSFLSSKATLTAPVAE